MSELENAPDRHSGPGPWFIAALDGACSCCGDDIVEGDEIRADGHGRWEGRGCCGGDDHPGPRAERSAGTTLDEMGF